MTIEPAKEPLSTPDLEARFASVYEQHFDAVWMSLRRLGVSPAELDDATQETFLVAFRRWDDFRPDASWRAWLLGIARRVASRHRRGSGRRLRLVRDAEREPSLHADPHDEIARRHAAALVERFVEMLPPGKREVFVLAEIEGLTGVEIAHALAIKPNTVGSRLRGAREAFERHLATLRAKERGASERLDRARLLERCRSARPPDRSRRRVSAALGIQLARGPHPVWWSWIKPAAISLGLGAAGLATVAGVARLTTASPGTGPPATRAAVAHSVPGTPRSRSPHEERSSEAGPAMKTVVPTSVPRTPTAVPETADARPEPPSATPPRRTDARPTHSDDEAPEAAALDPSRFAEETALLHAIRRSARSGEHARTLELAEDHARRFETGVLAPERQALEIAALCHLGRSDDARDRASTWSRQHADQPLAADVRHGCAGTEEKPTKSGPAMQDP